ncbi:MAG: hypothetical protein LBT06_12665 [Hungatella sp.]|jgi:hypothetical protein|nr:hypothetical protein [Hungatella sp.]MDR1549421.1 hypothetical protein [Hungatella sp.]
MIKKDSFMARYTPVYGSVMSVNPLRTSSTDKSCTMIISVMSESLGQTNFIVTPQTYVVDQHTFNPGDTIVAFYDTKAPVPLIYPPQYTAVILAENIDGYEVVFDYFDENLLNSSQTLKLNLNDLSETTILLSNGQTFFYNPGGHFLLVFYAFTTRSIPALTTPQMIVVFCAPERKIQESP